MGEQTTKQTNVYYQLKFQLKSSLLIGSGLSEITDSDLLLDSGGKPYIPGSTVAGMLRALADPGDRTLLFGDLDVGQSRIRVYDAVCVTSVLHITTRDSVALDKNKTALDNLKFDCQVLEPDAEFVGVIELRKGETAETYEKAESLIGRLARRGCAFGSKKNRGMGLMAVTACKKTFDFADAAQKASWLAFDPFDAEAFKDGDAVAADGTDNGTGETIVDLKLRLNGGISIRVYTTDVESADYRTMAYEKDQRGEVMNAALVPGTSWAGAFRSRVLAFAGEEAAQSLFGYVIPSKGDEKTTTRQSYVRFSETVITGGGAKRITRNAIDRFTGKTRDGALYSEQTYYNGSGNLRIAIRRLPRGASEDASRYAMACRALGAAIADLHHGCLAVGGLTSVGRGLFTIERMTVDGEEFALSGDGWENRLITRLGDLCCVSEGDVQS